MMPGETARVFILMGVSGCGKSTLGELLANETGGRFFDGDDFHPPENVRKMQSGTPLTDADRQSWLENLRALIEERLEVEGATFIACSALRQRYREVLLHPAEPTTLIFLKGSEALIAERLSGRTDHFMPAALLRSQFETLEEPEDAFEVDIRQSPEAQAKAVRSRFGL